MALLFRLPHVVSPLYFHSNHGHHSFCLSGVLGEFSALYVVLNSFLSNRFVDCMLNLSGLPIIRCFEQSERRIHLFHFAGFVKRVANCTRFFDFRSSTDKFKPRSRLLHTFCLCTPIKTMTTSSEFSRTTQIHMIELISRLKSSARERLNLMMC